MFSAGYQSVPRFCRRRFERGNHQQCDFLFLSNLLPFAMAAVPFGIIELFIKKGRTGPGLLGVILNLFVIVCVYTIVAVDTNLQFGF